MAPTATRASSSRRRRCVAVIAPSSPGARRSVETAGRAAGTRIGGDRLERPGRAHTRARRREARVPRGRSVRRHERHHDSRVPRRWRALRRHHRRDPGVSQYVLVRRGRQAEGGGADVRRRFRRRAHRLSRALRGRPSARRDGPRDRFAASAIPARYGQVTFDGMLEAAWCAEGELVRCRSARAASACASPTAERAVLPIPWGDLETAYRTTRIPNITTYMSFPSNVDRALRTTWPLSAVTMPVMRSVLGAAPIKRAILKSIETRVKGPDAARAADRSVVRVARASDPRGNGAEAWLERLRGVCLHRRCRRTRRGAHLRQAAFGTALHARSRFRRRLRAGNRGHVALDRLVEAPAPVARAAAMP